MMDPKGTHTAGWGLALTVMDMAKIGQMYLNQGFWNGRQVLSSTWIKDSTQESSRWGDLAYGYLWWIVSNEGGGCYAALGDGGNAIYVNSNKKNGSYDCFAFHAACEGQN
ncbi:hypothetical protein ACFSQ7_08375 [Paenibacillus rhizoplanae]